MTKKHLFSVTKKDLIVQTFRSGGKGGQHQNTTDSGVRIIHPESGAVGESREHRSQHQNKKSALKRLTEHIKFKVWLNRKCFEVENDKTIDQIIDEKMTPDKLKIEKIENGQWVDF